MLKKIFLAAAGISLAIVSLSSKANLLTNGNFQAGTATVGNVGEGYCYEPVGVNFYTESTATVNASECTAAMSGWSGYFPIIASNSTIWGTPSNIAGWKSSFGSTVVGLQQIVQVAGPTTAASSSSSSFSQTVAISGPETLTLSWDDAMRQGYGTQATSAYGTSAGYEVSFNGVDLGNFTVSVNDPWTQNSVTFTAPGAGVLEFQSVDINQALNYSDVTALFTDLSLTPSQTVPEPGSIFLFGIAIAGIAVALRKRQA